MNNIEMLENYIKALREPMSFNYTNEQKARAIENLIQENKELEENLKIATAMLTKGTYPEQNEGDNDFCKQFIPKSKVKEKIKYIEKNYGEHSEFSIGKSIEFLQELL